MLNKTLLKTVSGLGFLIFTLVFTATFLITKDLERSALAFVSSEVTKEVHSRIDKLTGLNEENPNIIKKAFLKKYATEVPKLKNELEKHIEKSTIQLCNPPNNQNKTAQLLLERFKTKLDIGEYGLIKSSLESIDVLIKDKYKKTWSSLLSDIRIFSAVNTGSFAIILILSIVLSNIPKYLSFTCWVLIFSTIFSILIYVYGQNWFFTIIFDKYYGTGYLTLLSCIFGYLLFRLSIDYALANEKDN